MGGGSQQSVPPDQLLVFSVAEGWDPLCAFLGVPVPSVPFPRMNETEAMKALPLYTAENAAGLLGISVEEVWERYKWGHDTGA